MPDCRFIHSAKINNGILNRKLAEFHIALLEELFHSFCEMLLLDSFCQVALQTV